jgi:hypothetical protein
MAIGISARKAAKLVAMLERINIRKAKKAKKIKVKAKAKAKVAKKVKAKRKVKKIISAPPVKKMAIGKAAKLKAGELGALVAKRKAGKVGAGGKVSAAAAVGASGYAATKGKKKTSAVSLPKGNVHKALGPRYVKASMLSSKMAKRPDLYVKKPQLSAFEKEMRRVHKKYGIKAKYPKG